MSKHYCPAGKIECERYYVPEGHPSCFMCGPHAYNIGFEVCPWPSQQKPIVKLELTEYGRGWKGGHVVGRAEGFRLAREAVEKLMPECTRYHEGHNTTEEALGIQERIMQITETLAAIDEAEKGE